MAKDVWIETPDCRENGIRFARALAMGDRWRYRALDLAGDVLAEGELGEPERITDGEVRWSLCLTFAGTCVAILCDSPMLGESIRDELVQPCWQDGAAQIRLTVSLWLTEEEPADFPESPWATGDNSIVPYECGRSESRA